MAYFLQNDDKDEDVTNQQPVFASSNNGTAAGGAPRNSSPTQSNTSGSFTNIQKLLDANKDQSVMMGNKVAADVDKKVTDASNTINNSQNEFINQIKSGTINYDQNKINNTIQNPLNVGQDVKDLISGQYKGPTDFRQTDMYDGYQSASKDLSDLDNNFKTTGGRDEIISGTFKNNTSGRSYDRFLTEKTPGAYNAIAASISKTKPVIDKANNLDPLNQQVSQAQATSKAAGQQATSALGAARDKIMSDVNKTVQEKIATDKTTQDAVKQAIAANNFDGLTKLGFTQEDINKLKLNQKRAQLFDENINENSYLNLTDPNAIYNAGNVATDDQRNKYAAFENLLGGTSKALDKTDQQMATLFNANGLSKDFEKVISDGLMKDEATRLAARGDFANVTEAYNALVKAQNSENNKNLISTGASIGSYFGPWGTVIGAALGAVAGAFGLGKSEHTQGTKDYESYKGADPNISGRDFTDEQLGGIAFNIFKKHQKDPGVRDFADALGLNKGKESLIAFEGKFKDIASQAIKDAQAEGLLPNDPNELSKFSGDRIFKKIVAPKLDKMIGAALGKQNYTMWSNNPGLLSNIMSDLTDKVLVGAHNSTKNSGIDVIDESLVSPSNPVGSPNATGYFRRSTSIS